MQLFLHVKDLEGFVNLQGLRLTIIQELPKESDTRKSVFHSPCCVSDEFYCRE